MNLKQDIKNIMIFLNRVEVKGLEEVAAMTNILKMLKDLEEHGINYPENRSDENE